MCCFMFRRVHIAAKGIFPRGHQSCISKANLDLLTKNPQTKQTQKKFAYAYHP